MPQLKPLAQTTTALSALIGVGLLSFSTATGQEEAPPKKETKPVPTAPTPEKSETPAPSAADKFDSPKGLQSYALGMYFGPNNRYYFNDTELDEAALRQGLEDVFGKKKDFSYAVGASVALQIAHRDPDVDVDQLLAGLLDSFHYRKTKINRDEQREGMSSLEASLKQKRQQQIADSATKNEQKGKTFLASNKDRDGVQTTESGLQYEVLSKSSSVQKAGEQDTVTVNYKASNLAGKIYDRTDEGTPKKLSLKSRYMLEGWKEGLKLMTVGSKYKFYIPHDLAYGMEPRSSALGGNETLVWEVELVGTAPPRTRPTATRPGASAVTPPVRVPIKDGKTGKATAVTPPVKVEFPKNPKKDPKRGVRVTPPVKVEFPKKKEDATKPKEKKK